MRLGFVALVASTGCAQLFGIDETTAVDANTSVASIQVQHVSIGASVIKTPQDMSAQMATFYDDSVGTFAPVPGVLAAMDTFTGQAAGTPPAIFTVPEKTVPTRMWATPARTQRGNFMQFEHPNTLEPLMNSAFHVTVMLPSPYVTGEGFAIQAIGAWMTRTLPAGDLPAPDTAVSTISPTTDILYSVFAQMTAAPKARITMADVVLLERYTNNAAGAPFNGGSHLSGVFQAQPFEQSDGVDTISGTMTTVQQSSTLSLSIDPTGFATRFAAARPAVTGLSMPWRVSAAPGYSLGSEVGVRLINGAFAMADTGGTAMYGNPFESLDWKAMYTGSAVASRTYAYAENAMMANVTLSASFTTVAELAQPMASLNLANGAGLPITIEANQATLVTDGMTLTVDPTKAVVVEATLDRATNTAYQLTLVELGLDTSGMTPVTTKRIVLDAITAGAPAFKVPPEMFTTGKSYYFTFRAFQGGIPEIADGNLQTASLPYSFASLDSAVFTVGMP